MRVSLIVFSFLTIFIFESPAQCFLIESILVDACGFPEGPNEMVRIKIGNSDLNTADINPTWPNNPFQGICQDATTANKVAYMNSTIVSCGYFKEPQGGILPANSTVLIITSTDFDETAHDYAGLQDTIYVIFQCSGNTSGHFANWADSSCPPGSSPFRTTTISFGGGCVQDVTYDRCELVNQNGTIGGTSAERDGARVNFDPSGNPTYENDGCTIPYTPLSIEVGIVGGATNVVCEGNSVDLFATLTSTAIFIEWESDHGVFAQPNNLTTDYSPQTGAPTHYVYFLAVNACEDTLRDSIEIIPQELPQVEITTNVLSQECFLGSIELVASGADTYLWNTNENTPTIQPSASGVYSVTGTNSCGSDSDETTVMLGNIPICTLGFGDTIFVCKSDGEIVLSATTNADNLVWNNGKITQSVSVGSSGYYFFSASNDCGSCTSDSVWVEVIQNEAKILASPESGSSPLETTFLNQTEAYSFFYWVVESDTITEGEFIHIFEDIGEYEVYLFVLDLDYGCADSAAALISVFNDPVINIPNVFTPNNDGVNDAFYPKFQFANLEEAQIFNRWGAKVFEFNGNDKWAGSHFNGEDCPDGVYTYIMSFTAFDGETILKQGAVHLKRAK